jgi:archaellin
MCDAGGRHDARKRRARGQTDVVLLFAFIVAVVAVLVVVPFVLGMAGIDVRHGSMDGNESVAATETGPVVVLGAYGSALDDNRTSIGSVDVLLGTGNGTVDLTEMTVRWEGADSYQLVPPDVNVGDASFTFERVSGGPVLTNASDRVSVRFDLGTNDTADAQRFGERLAPGDSVQLTLTTDDGRTTRVELTVPSPLPAGAAVRLDVRSLGSESSYAPSLRR